MRIPILLAALLAGSLHSQDSKPARTESAPAAKPTEITALGKKVAITIPAGWSEAKAPSTFAREEWKAIKAWAHPTVKGFAIRAYAAEGKDASPAAVTQKCLDAVGSTKAEVVVSVTGKNKTLKGLDTEVETFEKQSHSFYWMRAIAIPPKDKVLVILAEASPLDREQLEDVVLAARPILDSVFDASGKDPWRRDPNVTVTCGELVTRLTVPAGWSYTRLAPEGSLIWMGQENRQEIVLAFPLRSLRIMSEEAALSQVAPMLYKTLGDADDMIADKLGKILSKTAVTGHDQARESVTVIELPEVGVLWQRRRLFLDGPHVISLLAKHPLPDASALPPEAAQKQVGSVMDSLKVEIVRNSK
jgi:hypothetical protein